MQVLWIAPALDLHPGPQMPPASPSTHTRRPLCSSTTRPLCTAAGESPGCHHPRKHTMPWASACWAGAQSQPCCCPQSVVMSERAVGLTQPFTVGCAEGDEHASSLGQRRKWVTHRVSRLCSPSKPLAPRLWIRLLCRCLWTKQRCQWRCKLTSSCSSEPWPRDTLQAGHSPGWDHEGC